LASGNNGASRAASRRHAHQAHPGPASYPPGVNSPPRTDVFDQARFAARFEWGEAGIRALAPAVDVLVLVDVLSFTTAVEVAVARGAIVYPYGVGDTTAASLAARLGGVLAVDRRQVSAERPLSLSPPSLTTISAGTRLVLPSPNGSALTVLAASLHRSVLAGCLRNATAVAGMAQALGSTVGVIAAGERWADGTRRFAVEDLLGAGAILSHFPPDAWSPEAAAAVAGYERGSADLARYLRDCASGRELVALGFPEDVNMAAELDVSDVVPSFQQGAYARNSFS
jgi:2-phosphosulfolactate phosphatase